MADKSGKTLGELLPGNQAELLTENAKKLTKSELEESLNRHPDTGLYFEDLSSLRKLATRRINKGETPFSWSSHDFKDEDKEHDHPSTCICII